MLKYLRTKIPAQHLTLTVQRYARDYLKSYHNADVDRGLQEDYGVSLEEIKPLLASSLRTAQAERMLVQVYFERGVYIKGRRLTDIVDFLEYGSLEIRPPKLPSDMFNYISLAVESETGGL